MNLEQKRRLSTALRSGAFKQCTQSLCERDAGGNKSHCVLGVVCEVFGIPYQAGRFGNVLDAFGMPRGYDFSQVDLSSSQVSDLWMMNDGGATFDEIADFVENSL